MNIKNYRIRKMKGCFKCHQIILSLSLVFSMSAGSKPLSFMLMPEEGGSQASKAKLSFERHMSENGCNVKVSFINKTIKGSALYFSAKPSSISLDDHKQYERLVKIKTYKNTPLTSAVLIKSSIGISDLKSTKGERISVVSKGSHLGGMEIQKLYNEAGIKLDKHDIYEAGSYEGVIALLLHGDVFVAGLPGPLARRWAIANNLTIIAESEVLSIGDVWIRKALPDAQKQACKNALVSLKRTNRRDKRMSIFPAWVEGFK